MKINLDRKISDKTATIGVIGLGYVGLPLAVEFAKNGFKVIGIDTNKDKVNQLLLGNSYITDIDKSEINRIINDKRFVPITDYSMIQNMDTISICVPTPLNKSMEPDLTCLNEVVINLKKYIRPQTLIILESTSYPGTTEEIIGHALDSLGYSVGKDYSLCFSPERIDPGNKRYEIRNTPKVIGGVTSKCLELAQLLYGSIIDKIIPVSSPKVAEMSKLLENTFRSINIAFINELALMCDVLDINVWEVIAAASTKPFGFMPFYPGPGIGGHCIPLDPMYLNWKAKSVNFYSRFIELAQKINKEMPKNVVDKIADSLNLSEKCINGAKIMLLGIAYKADTADIRESPSLEVYELLKEKGAILSVNDPYCSVFENKEGCLVNIDTNLEYNKLSMYDCVVLLTAHTSYNYGLIVNNSRIIIDTRNAFSEYKDYKNIVRLGDSLKHYFYGKDEAC